MRKLIAFGTSLVLCAALAACGGDDDDDAGGSGGGGGGSTEEFCDKARDYEEEFADADPSDEEAIDALRDLADSAPSDISDDMNGLIDLFEQMAEAGEDPEALAELSEQAEDMTAASERITTFMEDECGITSE